MIERQRESLTVSPSRTDTNSREVPQAETERVTTVLVVIIELYRRGWHIATYLSTAIMINIMWDAEPNVWLQNACVTHWAYEINFGVETISCITAQVSLTVSILVSDFLLVWLKWIYLSVIEAKNHCILFFSISRKCVHSLFVVQRTGLQEVERVIYRKIIYPKTDPSSKNTNTHALPVSQPKCD